MNRRRRILDLACPLLLSGGTGDLRPKKSDLVLCLFSRFLRYSDHEYISILLFSHIFYKSDNFDIFCYLSYHFGLFDHVR